MPGWFVPEYFGEVETGMYFDTTNYNETMINDSTFADLFHDAYFNMDLTTEDIREAREELFAYCEEEYDFDFEAEFDWEWYREFYG